MEEEVTVYLYTYWDEEAQSRKTSLRYATMDMIGKGLGQPVSASAIKVGREDLIQGMYMPQESAPESTRLPAEEQE